MDQYHPCYKAGEYQPLNRCITSREFEEAVAMAQEEGIRRIDGISV